MPLVPEVTVLVADDVTALWERTEERAGSSGQPPPFWGFPWAGGQALARCVLDAPGLVAGRRVLDLACGCGLVGVAAALAGAAAVRAVDTDPLAAAATALAARLNGVVLQVDVADLLDGDAGDVDVVLVGDLFYERATASRLLPFLHRARADGADVLVGDPGRAYLPRAALAEVARYDVPVVADLEDRQVRSTAVWRLLPAPAAGRAAAAGA